MTLYRWDSAERRFTATSVDGSMRPSEGSRPMRVEKGQRVRAEVATGDLCIQMIEGALRVEIADNQLTVQHDDAVIIPSGFSHSAEALEDSFAVRVEEDQEHVGTDSRWAV